MIYLLKEVLFGLALGGDNQGELLDFLLEECAVLILLCLILS